MQDPKVAPLRKRRREGGKERSAQAEESAGDASSRRAIENLPDTDVGPDEVGVGHGWRDDLDDGRGESGHEEVDGEDETLSE